MMDMIRVWIFLVSLPRVFFNTHLSKFPSRTLIVVTFDEADQVGGPDYAGNHIMSFFAW